MTTIRRISVSQVEGDGANINDINEIRPFGETAFYLDQDQPTPSSLTLMMFNGIRTHVRSKILSPGVFYGSNENSSDGLGYDTIKLIPDPLLDYNTDRGNHQYIIIEPTGGQPSHVHIRSGGPIDNSTADLLLGGELNHVKVSDTNDTVIISTDAGGEGATREWAFSPSGHLQFPGSSNGRIGEDEPGLVVYSDLNFGILTNLANTENSKSWIFTNDGSLTFPDNTVQTTAFPGDELFGAGTAQVGSTQTIVDDGSGGLVGWNQQALSIAYDPNVISTYPVGSTITWQDGTTATITQWDDYGPTYIDLFWDTPKTGTLFPITLTTTNYAAASPATARISVTSTGVGANTQYWIFDEDGNLTLPQGGTISETTIGMNPTVVIKPDMADSPNQALYVKGGAAPWPADYHLHLTTGDLTDTSIIVGTDDHNIRTTIEGGIELNSYNYNTSTQQTLAFGTDGAITTNDALAINVSVGIPDSISIIGSAGGWDSSPYTNLATTGGTGTGLTVDASSEGSGYLNTITINTSGSGYSNGDIITIENENNLTATFAIGIAAPSTWEFGLYGGLTFPDATIQTTAWAGGSVVFAPNTSIGDSTDVEGRIAFDSTYFYYCTANYNGTDNIWKRVAWSMDTW